MGGKKHIALVSHIIISMQGNDKVGALSTMRVAAAREWRRKMEPLPLK